MTLKGIIPIVAAVFDDEGNVDLGGFERLVHHLLGAGVNGLTLFGLATEFYKLTDRERDDMMRIMLGATRNVAQVAGIISITRHSLELAVLEAKKAEDQGADALMILPPFFLSPGPDAIMDHIRKVAGAVSIPVIIQYAPSQTGVRLAPEFFTRLQETCENARYVKVETQPPGKYAEAIHAGGRIQTLVGYAGVQLPDALGRGCAGIQPGCSFSEVYVKLYRLFTEGKTGEMQALFDRLQGYISYWMQGVELIIQAEKLILKKRGIIRSSYCRRPSYDLDEREAAMIDAFLAEFAAYLPPPV